MLSEGLVAILRGQVRANTTYQGSDGAMKSIKSTLSVLHNLSAIAALGDGVGLVRQKTPMEAFHIFDIPLQALPPAKAIRSGLGVLLHVSTFLKFLHAYCCDIEVYQPVLASGTLVMAHTTTRCQKKTR